MTSFTHERISRKGTFIQWTGDNAQEICALFDDARLYGSDYITIHHKDGINTLRIGDWAGTGEDGAVRFYTNEKFNLMYRALQ